MSEVATEDKNLQDVQDRLMKMLESVRLDPNVARELPPQAAKQESSATELAHEPLNRSSAAARSSTAEVTCPDCKTDTPWGDSPWCPKCGYHPKLKRRIAGAAADEQEPEDETPLELIDMIKLCPTWIIILSAGVMVVLAGTLTARVQIAHPVARSAVALLQVIIGLNVLGIAHVLACMQGARQDDDIGLISLVWAPIRIWKSLCSMLPKGKYILFAGSWSATAILCALLFLGVDTEALIIHYSNAQAKGVSPIKTLMSGMSKAAAESGPASLGSLEDSIADFAGEIIDESVSGSTDAADEQTGVGQVTETAADDEGMVKPNIPLDSPRNEEREYVILGYLTNSYGAIRSILLAETSPDFTKARFVGKYNVNLKDEKFVRDLQDTLDLYRVKQPAVKTPFFAKWTAPVVVCRIAYNGLTPDGRFDEAEIVWFYDRTKRPKATSENDSEAQSQNAASSEP